MGIANVIPGISGGTIALITEIYEELIDSLKSFDKKALKFLFSFKIKKLIQHTNFYFLAILFSGSIFMNFLTSPCKISMFFIFFKSIFSNKEATPFIYESTPRNFQSGLANDNFTKFSPCPKPSSKNIGVLLVKRL